MTRTINLAVEHCGFISYRAFITGEESLDEAIARIRQRLDIEGSRFAPGCEPYARETADVDGGFIACTDLRSAA